MDSPNPLKSLAKILEKAIEEGDGNRSILNVLCMAMNRQTASVEVVDDFYSLLSTCNKVLENLDQDSAVKHLKSIQTIFTRTNVWSDKWSNISGSISGGNYADLIRSYGENYSLNSGAMFLEEEFLQGLLDDFSQLASEVKASELDPRIKIFIVKHIEEIRSAISNYEIYGIDPLVSALEKSLAGLFFNPIVKLDLHEKTVQRKVVIQIMVLLRKAYRVATPVLAIVAFTADFSSLKTSIEEFREEVRQEEVRQIEASGLDLDKAQKLISSNSQLPELPPAQE